MIDKLYYLDHMQTEPDRNLALEEYLLHAAGVGECILYLWQNRNTVVIGKNQNAWKECRIQALEQDGVRLLRRLSGGGAVYHDLGNLNFTFLVRAEDYDAAKQTEVILEAVRAYGIDAQISGRNDITADGRKFSGNAYYSRGVHRYHHGTLLISADTEKMSRYLRVPSDKLMAKGVDSVRSRVCNLTDFHAGVTVAGMREKLAAAFSKVYGGTAVGLEEKNFKENEILEYGKKFSSWDFNYGKQAEFAYEAAGRFPWGGISIQFSVEGGKVASAAVYSDAMEADYIGGIAPCLAGCVFTPGNMAGRLPAVQAEGRLQERMAADIRQLLMKM